MRYDVQLTVANPTERSAMKVSSVSPLHLTKRIRNYIINNRIRKKPK